MYKPPKPKQYEDIDEIARDLYGMQSYFKDHVGFDRESNLIDKIRHELNVKEDKKIRKWLKDCKSCKVPLPDCEKCLVNKEARLERV